jgi:phage baseplate assembly protein W
MADDPQLLSDIRLTLRQSSLRPVYGAGEVEKRVKTGQGSTRQGSQTLVDLALVSGRDNLGQAILMRLLTPRGELAELAHPEYGSRLHELIGRQNTETTRGLVRLYILESLRQEPRVAKVLEVEVTPSPGTRDRLDVRLRVQPIGPIDPSGALSLGPFSLEL